MRLSLLDHALQLANHAECSVPPALPSLEQRALAEAAAHVQSVPKHVGTIPAIHVANAMKREVRL
jgi:hypothetical protein